MHDLRLTSELPADYQEALESLMFFNPLQQVAQTEIVESIERFGVPAISAADGRLRITVGAYDAQALFVLAGRDRELAGMILYVRIDLQTVIVLHIAVAERFAAGGEDAEALIVLRLLHAVRSSARRLKGVRSVTIMSPVSGRLRLPIRSADGTAPARNVVPKTTHA